MRGTSEADRGSIHASSDDMPTLVSLSAYLQERRRALNLTQRQVAHRVAPKVSLVYLQQLEQGRKENPSIEVVVQLAAALETDWITLGALVASRTVVKTRPAGKAIHLMGKRQIEQIEPTAQIRTLQERHQAQSPAIATRMLTLAIMAYDRSGLIFEVAAVVHQQHIDLHTYQAFDRGGVVQLLLSIDLPSSDKLSRLLTALEAVSGVFDVRTFDGVALGTKPEFAEQLAT